MFLLSRLTTRLYNAFVIQLYVLMFRTTTSARMPVSLTNRIKNAIDKLREPIEL